MFWISDSLHIPLDRKGCSLSASDFSLALRIAAISRLAGDDIVIRELIERFDCILWRGRGWDVQEGGIIGVLVSLSILTVWFELFIVVVDRKVGGIWRPVDSIGKSGMVESGIQLLWSCEEPGTENLLLVPDGPSDFLLIGQIDFNGSWFSDNSDDEVSRRRCQLRFMLRVCSVSYRSGGFSILVINV